MPFEILFGLADLLGTGIPYASKEDRRAARLAAEEQFRLYRASESSCGAADVSRCQVLDSSESFSMRNGKVQDYVLTLFAVTPENRYFHFKFNDSGRPYVRELTSERAELVLKKKFQPYNRAAAA